MIDYYIKRKNLTCTFNSDFIFSKNPLVNPNPASAKEITLIFKIPLKGYYSVAIHSLTGQKLCHQQMYLDETQQISLHLPTHLIPGIYLIRVCDEKFPKILSNLLVVNKNQNRFL